MQVLREDRSAWEAVTAQLARALGQDAESFFADPANYRGAAAEQARSLAEKYAQVCLRIRKELAV